MAGFGGSVLQWFQSYLSNRHQRVTTQGSTSTTLSVSSGVPQGSILGPVVNDLPDTVTSTVVTPYSRLAHKSISNKTLQLHYNLLRHLPDNLCTTIWHDLTIWHVMTMWHDPSHPTIHTRNQTDVLIMRHSTKHGLDPWTGPKIGLKIGPKIGLKILAKILYRCDVFVISQRFIIYEIP